MRLVKYRGIWCAYHEGKRKSLRTRDRSLAEQRLEDLKAQLKRKPETVDEIVSAYIEDMKERGGRSIETTEFSWKALEPVFRNLRPDQVTRERSREFVTLRRSEGISDGTIRRQLGVLSSALRWHDRNTPAIIERPPSPAPDDRYLTKAQVKKLIEHAEGHLRLFIHIAVATGARSAAILELTWDRVDIQRGLINLGRGHGNKKRATVPINSTLRPILDEAKDQATIDHVIAWGEKPVRSVKKGFSSAMKRAKLPPAGPRILRHSAAVWMAEAGVPMSEIAQYLGHTSTGITEKHYARYSPTHLRRASSALDL